MLLLNAHYAALRIVTVRRAFTLLFKRDASFQPVAEVVNVEEGRYVSYDFDDWAQLSCMKRQLEPHAHDWVRAVRWHLAVPRIIRVFTFARVPRRQIQFNRRNVFARDGHMCQYCGRRFGTSDLSLDHVVPRSHGGATSWENIVCACVSCNVRKGGRTPSQANLALLKPPSKPNHHPILNVKMSDNRYAVWSPFLRANDWQVELS